MEVYFSTCHSVKNTSPLELIFYKKWSIFNKSCDPSYQSQNCPYQYSVEHNTTMRLTRNKLSSLLHYLAFIWHDTVLNKFYLFITSTVQFYCGLTTWVWWETCQRVFLISISVGCPYSLGFRPRKVRRLSFYSVLNILAKG